VQFEELQRRLTPEPDLVPILDSLVCVIFFLLFSTSFIELTQMTVPPAVISKAQVQVAAPPLSPRLFVVKAPQNSLKLSLVWKGSQPGSVERRVARELDNKPSEKLENMAREMAIEFAGQFASEKTIQLAIDKEATYQELIDIMDGLKKNFPDLVLISYDEIKNKDVL
jgi:biopolymer transport protein ExbD